MSISILAIVPFILMLLSIAVMPILFEDFWDKNTNKLIVSIALSIPILIYLYINNYSHEVLHTFLFDYLPFIILLASLFIITGGIHISGNLEAKPITNTSFLAIGALLASFLGTTGASMLLIRPLINTNKERKFKVHTILFFIGIVANCGGLLTPLGDPPLFMMYLRGASFFWFLKLFPEWFITNLLLLLIYFLVDRHYYKGESVSNITKDIQNKKDIKLTGKINILFLVGVILSIAFINSNYIPLISANPKLSFIREILLILLSILSLKYTKKTVRNQNHFTWHPIQEVAFIFFGIFITMIPCLLYLNANAKNLGISSPHLFYFLSGGLSSILDNTPTAITFFELARGLKMQSATLVSGIPENLMKAICTGAVFFGSLTYIGNGPNFLVKTIAEHYHIKMPNFFEYMYKFSLIILLPIFILISLLL